MMFWKSKPSEPTEEPTRPPPKPFPDAWPDIPSGAIVVKPTPSGAYGLFRKRLEWRYAPHCFWELVPMTEYGTFATVDAARAHWEWMKEPPVVIDVKEGGAS